ncbi:hypothetical protein Gotur_004576 [Gossypium turneri]
MSEIGGSENLIEIELLKKLSFKDLVSGVNNEMVVDFFPILEVSWRVKLLGREAPNSGRDEDFEFLNGDVVRSMVNGIPVINFSERIQQILFREMATTVVVKLLGRNMSYSILQNRIQNLWKPTQQIHIMNVENGYFQSKRLSDSE